MSGGQTATHSQWACKYQQMAQTSWTACTLATTIETVRVWCYQMEPAVTVSRACLSQARSNPERLCGLSFARTWNDLTLLGWACRLHCCLSGCAPKFELLGCMPPGMPFTSQPLLRGIFLANMSCALSFIGLGPSQTMSVTYLRVRDMYCGQG